MKEWYFLRRINEAETIESLPYKGFKAVIGEDRP